MSEVKLMRAPNSFNTRRPEFGFMTKTLALACRLKQKAAEYRTRS